jgi:hypothetical protein
VRAVICAVNDDAFTMEAEAALFNIEESAGPP